jgi:hypothetical protein
MKYKIIMSLVLLALLGALGYTLGAIGSMVDVRPQMSPMEAPPPSAEDNAAKGFKIP